MVYDKLYELWNKEYKEKKNILKEKKESLNL